MGMFKKIGSFFSVQDDDDLYEEESLANARVVPLSNAGAGRRPGTGVSVYMPRNFSDIVEIADALRSRQVVIINLQGAERSLLQRVVDFTSGVIYVLDGKIQKLAEAIYLVVPAGVNVNAAGLRDAMSADGTLDFIAQRSTNN